MFKNHKIKRLYESTSGQFDAIDQLFGDMFCEPLVKYEKLNKDEILNGLKEMIDDWVENNPEMIKFLRFNSTSVDIDREYLVAIRINDEQFIRDFGQLYLDKLPGKSKIYLLVNEDREPVKFDKNLGLLNCYDEDDYIYILLKDNKYWLYDFDNKKEIDELGTPTKWFDKLKDYYLKNNNHSYDNSVLDDSKNTYNYTYTSDEEKQLISSNERIIKVITAISYVISLLYKNNNKLTVLNNGKKPSKQIRKLFKEVIEVIDINYISVNYNGSLDEKFNTEIESFDNEMTNYNNDNFQKIMRYLNGKSDVLDFTLEEVIQHISEFIIIKSSVIRENLITIQNIEFPDLIQLNTDNLIVLTETARDSLQVLWDMMNVFIKSMKS